MGILDRFIALINGNPQQTKVEVNQENGVDNQQVQTAAAPQPNGELDTTAYAQADEKTTDFKKNLYSTSLSEQRYAWHKHLMSLILTIDVADANILKHFIVYIERENGQKYLWNDEAFMKELQQDIKNGGRSYVGASSFSIEVISGKVLDGITKKRVREYSYFRREGNVCFYGSKTQSEEHRFTTAIDKRAYVIKALLKAFRSSTGTDSRLMENLVIVVIRDDDDEDMTKFDWVGKRFEEDLKRNLADAFLDQIGSKSLQIVFKPKSAIEDCKTLIENQIYYYWGKQQVADEAKPEELPYERVVASLTLIEGSGSLMHPIYTLDSDKKTTYHIGRGVTSRKGGKYRVNDIVIKEREADFELLESNGHVSSTHADVVFKNNKYYIKAAIGGCRASGGSATKIVHGEEATELRDTSLLYPLEDGDIIELGKTVLLQFSLQPVCAVQQPLINESRADSAMSIDESF